MKVTFSLNSIFSKGMIFALAAGFAVAACGGEKLIHDGETLVFLGDSITHYGKIHRWGYVNLVVDGLAANGIRVNGIGAGIPGHKAWQMKARFEKDVLANSPKVVTISAGVNDVWFQNADCTYDKFCVDMEDMVKRAKEAGIRPVLMTPTTAFGEGDNAKIRQYAEGVREIAKRQDVPVADTWKAVREQIDNPETPKLTDFRDLKATVDGVHMAPAGDRVMAREVLRTLGLDAAEMAKAEAVWNTDTNLCGLSSDIGISLADYQFLEAGADKQGMKIEALYREVFRRGVVSVLKDPSPEKGEPTKIDELKPDDEKGEVAIIGDYHYFCEKSNKSGLLRLVRAAIGVTGKDLRVFNEQNERGGTAGLNAYWDTKLAGRKIRYLVVFTGSYDAWANNRAEFPEMMKTLADKAVKAGAKVVFLTTRPTRSDVAKPFNEALRQMDNGDTVRVVDHSAIIAAELERRASNKNASCTSSGYPLNANVNFLTASAVLPCLGFTPEETAKAVASWKAMPDFATLAAETSVSFAEYDQLLQIAKKEGVPLSVIVDRALSRGVRMH